VSNDLAIPDWHLQKVVLGSSLPAALYAYFNNAPLIYPSHSVCDPFPFKFFPSSTSMGRTFILEEINQLVHPTGIDEVGNQKEEVYKRLCFVMSLAGLIPYSNRGVSVRRTEDNAIKVVCEKHTESTIFADEFAVFNDDGILGLEMDPMPQAEYEVADWFNVKFDGKHSYKLLKSSEEFISEFYFYTASRGKRRGVASSLLTHEELNEEGFSDHYSKLKIENMMKTIGMKSNAGNKIGTTIIQLHYPVVEHTLRETRKKQMRTGKEDNFVFYTMTSEEVLARYKDEPLETSASILAQELLSGN